MPFELRPPPLPYARSRSRFGPKHAKASVLFGFATPLLSMHNLPNETTPHAFLDHALIKLSLPDAKRSGIAAVCLESI
jgi:hypothetical protein